jgi:HEAT repeat protein
LAAGVMLALGVPSRADAFEWLEPIERLKTALSADSGAARVRAIRSVEAIELAEAEPIVIEALGDEHVPVAVAAAGIAARNGFTRARAPLTAWLGRAEPALRLSAARALAQLGDSTTAMRLARLLEDPEPEVRSAAVDALASLKTRESVPALLQRIDDPSTEVQIGVIDACVALGDSRCIPFVMRKLDDPLGTVRRAAARALGGLGAIAAASDLLRLLADRDEQVVIAAIETLGQLRHAPAAKPLSQLLARRSAGLRRHAATALGRIGTRTSTQALVQQLDDAHFSSAVREALAHAPSHRVAAALRELINSQSTGLEAAVTLASELRLAELTPELVELLDQRRLPPDRIARALGLLFSGGPARPNGPTRQREQHPEGAAKRSPARERAHRAHADRERAQRALLALAEHATPETRRIALEALTFVADERARDVVRRLLVDPLRSIRLVALRLAGLLKDPQSVVLLRHSSRSFDLAEAREATRALGRVDHQRGRRALTALLRHHDGEVRRLAVESLLASKHPLAPRTVIRSCRTVSGPVRADCIQVLAAPLRKHADQATLAFLERELGRGDDHVSSAVISVLSACADRRATEVLLAALTQLSPPLKARALEGLRAGDRRTDLVELLRNSVNAPSAQLRASAAWTIGRLGLHELAASVRRLIHTSDWAARVNAVAALARLRQHVDCDLFRLLLTDSNRYLRANAERSRSRAALKRRTSAACSIACPKSQAPGSASTSYAPSSRAPSGCRWTHRPCLNG